MAKLLSILGINPTRIGGQEAFARELSLQLAFHGWESALCFSGTPPQKVREYMSLPNVSLDVLDSLNQVRWAAINGFAGLLKRHRPKIVHLHYTGFLGPYPWL